LRGLRGGAGASVSMGRFAVSEREKAPPNFHAREMVVGRWALTYGTRDGLHRGARRTARHAKKKRRGVRKGVFTRRTTRGENHAHACKAGKKRNNNSCEWSE